MNGIILEPSGSARSGITDDIVIGKDILELLTGAMYVDPLCIYREYVQNAVDAVEDAADVDLYTASDRPRIDIWIDTKTRSIRIRDNGVGLPRAEFVRRLTSIGASAKRGRPRRGFRGVGRLSGLGFCHELVFKSRVAGESDVSEIAWDGRRLRETLRNLQSSDDLVTTMRAVVQRATLPAGDYPKRFFEVELKNISRIKNDLLLNSAVVRNYLSQVAPVAFDDTFSFSTEIEAFLQHHHVGFTCPITIHDGLGEVRRPFTNSFPLRASRSDRFTGVDTFTLAGSDNEVAAVGWLLKHHYLGSIPKALGIGGLRLRVNNIQIGSSDLTSPQFQETRFNEWCVGEIHVLSKKIVPNGRRDDFEASNSYQQLQTNVSVVARKITKACRDQSGDRTRLARAKSLSAKIEADLRSLRIWSSVADIATRHLSDVRQSLQRLDKLVASSSLDSRSVRPLRQVVSALKASFESLADQPARRSSKPMKPERVKLARNLLETINRSLSPSKSSEQLASAVLRLTLARK